MDYEIECVNCSFVGLYSELLQHPDDDDKSVDESRFNVCPECGAIGMDNFNELEEGEG